MNENASVDSPDRRQALLDELVRVGIPEIKLALGEVIDRENKRPLPPKYARLLPDTVLIVTLREDAADALRSIASDLERELTDSCNRHGSLYDRRYRVRFHRSRDPDAPLYSVSLRAGGEEVDSALQEAVDDAPLPMMDPDATVTGYDQEANWEDSRWMLIVENDGGQEQEAFRISEPVVTIGRSTDDPRLRPAIAISDAPHVSRRQLALAWSERDGAPGFQVYNLGLNAVHLPQRVVPGAHRRGEVDLTALPDDHTTWLPPGVPLRIGDQGPTLRIEEVPPDADELWVDPDATIFD